LRDMDMLRNFMSGTGLFAFFDAPWVPIFLGILFLFHPLIGVIAVIGGIILLGLAMLNELLSRKAYSEISSGTVEATNFAEASLRNSEAIKAMGMLGDIRKSWQDKHDRLKAAQSKSNEQSAIIMALAKYIRVTLQIGVMGTGAFFVISGHFTPGVMIASSILMGRALAPLEQSVGQWRGLGSARSAYARLQELLEKFPGQQEGMDLPTPLGELTIEKLVVAPPGVREPILKGVNAKLLPGETLGIFGPSGAGKSSLARILVGVWPARSGSVRLDDADVFTWNSEHMGQYIGYLPQDVELFDGTVSENIGRFSGADSESVIAAAEAAGVNEMILRLPEGYDTRIGEGGGGLSGGQRQRIALARALFGGPLLVVLDEPNSNLDADGEMALVTTIKKLKAQGTTVVVVAHRPNILAQLDKIMFLKGGVVEAFGPREQVMKKLMGSGGRPQGKLA
jgi:PrtD family type I secretion system ABC transporter